MAESNSGKIDDVGRTFEAIAAYCVETAELAGADHLALFLQSDRLQVRPAFLCTYGHVIAAFLDEKSLDEAKPCADVRDAQRSDRGQPASSLFASSRNSTTLSRSGLRRTTTRPRL
jgi:hypothetical protein